MTKRIYKVEIDTNNNLELMKAEVFWINVREKKFPSSQKFKRKYKWREIFTIFILIEEVLHTKKSLEEFLKKKSTKKIRNKIEELELSERELQDIIVLYRIWERAPDKFQDA